MQGAHGGNEADDFIFGAREAGGLPFIQATVRIISTSESLPEISFIEIRSSTEYVRSCRVGPSSAAPVHDHAKLNSQAEAARARSR